MGRSLSDMSDGACSVRNILNNRRVRLQRPGHCALSGEQDAPPTSAKRRVRLAEVEIEKAAIHNALLLQYWEYLHLTLKVGRNTCTSLPLGLHYTPRRDQHEGNSFRGTLPMRCPSRNYQHIALIQLDRGRPL